MTTVFDPPRPWTASYAEGVPEDLAPISGSLIDLVADSARDFPDAPNTANERTKIMTCAPPSRAPPRM